MEIKPISTQTHPKPDLKSTQNKINSKQNPIENPFKKKKTKKIQKSNVTIHSKK